MWYEMKHNIGKLTLIFVRGYARYFPLVAVQLAIDLILRVCQDLASSPGLGARLAKDRADYEFAVTIFTVQCVQMDDRYLLII